MAAHTSFGGATGAVGSTSGAAAGGLRFHAGVQNMASSGGGVHNMDDESLISKSENRNQFKMVANDDTLSGLVGLDNNNAGPAAANNDTKMSDNEAFLAYMSKAEAGDDDDDEDL